MNEKHLYTLLRIIHNNGNIKSLIRVGLSFSRIGELNSKAISEGLVALSMNEIKLTKEGLDKMQELEVLYKKINKEEWIEKDFESMIPKLDKKLIYLPDQNELTF